MNESMTVTVGLDVHARSIRLAAVRADELLEERTLPYDPEAVERVLRRWPEVRCCYEAGPTGFGLQRHLVERGIDCRVVAPGLVPQRPGDRVKTDSRDARKLARLLAGGLLEPIHVPSREWEAARDLVRAREDARLDRMRDRHRPSPSLPCTLRLSFLEIRFSRFQEPPSFLNSSSADSRVIPCPLSSTTTESTPPSAFSSTLTATSVASASREFQTSSPMPAIGRVGFISFSRWSVSTSTSMRVTPR